MNIFVLNIQPNSGKTVLRIGKLRNIQGLLLPGKCKDV